MRPELERANRAAITDLEHQLEAAGWRRLDRSRAEGRAPFPAPAWSTWQPPAGEPEAFLTILEALVVVIQVPLAAADHLPFSARMVPERDEDGIDDIYREGLRGPRTEGSGRTFLKSIVVAPGLCLDIYADMVLHAQLEPCLENFLATLRHKLLRRVRAAWLGPEDLEVHIAQPPLPSGDPDLRAPPPAGLLQAIKGLVELVAEFQVSWRSEGS